MGRDRSNAQEEWLLVEGSLVQEVEGLFRHDIRRILT